MKFLALWFCEKLIYFLHRLIGMFEQNNVGIRLENPVSLLVRDMHCSSSQVDAILRATKCIVSIIAQGINRCLDHM